MIHMKRIKTLIKISLKSLLKKNRGNKLFLICIILMILIPTFLYSTTQSLMNQLEDSHKKVFGNFTDIYYDTIDRNDTSLDFSDEDLKSILPGFHYENFGVFYTTYKQELSNNKVLHLGYADNMALDLAEVTILNGTMPQSNDEIAITESIAVLLGNKIVGDTVEINRSTYSICGLIQDFGHLWPKGQIQIENNINPVNVFVINQVAGNILKESGELTRQILIVRQLGISNPIESNTYFYRNVNNSLENQRKFIIPTGFRVLIYIASIIMLFMILTLNRYRLAKRIKIYHLLGLIKSEILLIVCFESGFLSIIGLSIGVIFGWVISIFALKFISSFIDQLIPFVFDLNSAAILLLMLFIGICVIILFFNRYIVKKAIKEEHKEIKRYQSKTKKISLLKFELWQSRRSLILLTILIIFAFSLLSFGVFYGKYFSRDLLHVVPGTVPRDYDFQFITRIQPAPPLEKGKKAFYFTNTYEKIGATSDFIDELLMEPAVKSVKAYKEINKMHVLLKESQTDDYIDAYDAFFDGNCNQVMFTGIVDFNSIRKHFDYQDDEILISGEVLAYPPEVLKSLERSVIEGKIDIDKIISGEEVILRVPAFTITQMKDGGIARSPASYLHEDAFNSTTFKVGDEIHLSGLFTDEMINGPVSEDQIELYYRHDAIVKVGAIIRSTDGLLPYKGTVGGRTFSILTVDEVLVKMNMPATYSVVSIYTKDGYSVNELSQIITNYSHKVPYMILQDWQADIQTYKVFNLMIYILVITLLIVLSLTTLVNLMSQLMIKTQLSMKNYALLRINGLSYWKLIRIWLFHVCIIIFTGCLLGVPFSFLTIHFFGIQAKYDLLKKVIYYFPLINLVYVFLGILAISIFSMIPSLLYLKKHKDNVLYDIY